MNTNPIVILMAAQLALSAALCHGQTTRPAPAPPAAQPRSPRPVSPSTNLVARLGSTDPSQRSAALAEARQVVQGNPAAATTALRSNWIQALIDVGAYADADELALLAICAGPFDSGVTYQLQVQRVLAMRASGNKDQAIVYAKSAYNVVPMSTTHRAMLVLYECLADKDPALAEQFREEQIAGSTASSPPSGATLTSNAAPATHRTAVLESIRVDPKAYEAGLAQVRAVPTMAFQHFLTEGDLLLLADRPAEARVAFQQAYYLANVQSRISLTNDGLARTVKAELGSIGAANAFAESVRPTRP